jgi:hypothetical protein
MLPSLGIELPHVVILIPRLCERLAGHFAIRAERHFELSAAWRGGGERLAIEEGRSDVAGRHWLRCKGCAREQGVCRRRQMLLCSSEDLQPQQRMGLKLSQTLLCGVCNENKCTC